jgi:hypothetical protein
VILRHLTAQYPAREARRPLRRERDGSRSGRRPRQRGEDGEVGMKLDALDPAHAEWRELPFVLEPAELRLDRIRTDEVQECTF